MVEEVKKDVEHEAQAAVQASESQPEQAEAPNSTEAKRDDAAYNWAEARKAREEDRRQMQELDRKNRDLAEELANFKRQKETSKDEEEMPFADSDIVEGKYVKQLKRELKDLKTYIKQKEVSTLDERLTLRLPDFNEVVTKENIELLKQTEPELAESLLHNPDPYKQGVAAYKMLKKLGVGPTVKVPEKEKAQVNSQKPLSVSAVTKQSAIGNAHLFENGLTPELKSQLWKEMEECRKRA